MLKKKERSYSEEIKEVAPSYEKYGDPLQKIRIYCQARPSLPTQDAINAFIIRKLNPLVVVDFRFMSAFLHA